MLCGSLGMERSLQQNGRPERYFLLELISSLNKSSRSEIELLRLVMTRASYSVGLVFKSRLRDRFFWLRFSWFTAVTLDKCQDSALN
jgi:hypothetical protein